MLIGVVSLLLMPVDYRGGAAVSHPHATMQLIANLAVGSLDHHSPAPARHNHLAATSIWSPLGPLTAGLEFPNLVDNSGPQAPVVHTAAAVAGLTTLANDALVLPLSLDSEQVTPWSSITGKYLLYALVLPPAMLFAWNLGRGRLDRWTSRLWRGVPSTPELPPPRRSSLPAPDTLISVAG